MPCKIGVAYLNVARQQKTDHQYSKGRTNVAAKAEEPRAIRAILRWQGSKGHDIQRHENQPKTHALKQTRPHHGMPVRSEEHTSELQSLMRISYVVLCLKKNKKNEQNKTPFD